MEVENSNTLNVKIKWGRKKLDFELETTDCYDTFKGNLRHSEITKIQPQFAFWIDSDNSEMKFRSKPLTFYVGLFIGSQKASLYAYLTNDSQNLQLDHGASRKVEDCVQG